jgi:hypothetical protein
MFTNIININLQKTGFFNPCLAFHQYQKKPFSSSLVRQSFEDPSSKPMLLRTNAEQSSKDCRRNVLFYVFHRFFYLN